MSDERTPDDSSSKCPDPASNEPPPATDDTPYSTERASEELDTALPECPLCGTPVWAVSVIGPLEARASPCGCTVTPGLLERD